MFIPEELLHFIWRFRLFNQFNIKTVEGDPVQIIDPGLYNKDAGPDFELARLRIGETLWSGHVEMHVCGKDWTTHKHHLDDRYNSTVLHVVWEHDVAVERRDGTVLPTLELKNRVDKAMIDKYLNLMNNMNKIPCEKQIRERKDDLTLTLWMERMLIERFEHKTQHLDLLLLQKKNHWQVVLMLVLGRAFGMQVNADPFQALMEKVNLSLLLKYHTEPLKLEALLFGVSGLLPSTSEVSDSYTELLNEEYSYLRQLHGLTSLSKLSWKFHRMRPYNFPTFRLAQLAALCTHELYWFDKIREMENVEDIMQLLRNVQTNSYWQKHFRFGAVTKIHSTNFTDRFINHLFINCFVSALFAYGVLLDNESYRHKALNWLLQLSKERNAVTKIFEELGWKHDNSADSQALLHLKKEYCDRRKCLSCSVGLSILKAD